MTDVAVRVLVVPGLMVAFFLFYLALGEPTLQLVRRMRGWPRGFGRLVAGPATELGGRAPRGRLLRLLRHH